MEEILLLKFERFFKDPIRGYITLGPNMNSPVCINIRRSLELLNVTVIQSEDESSYDENLKNSIVEFQEKYNHRAKDGLFGPRTRSLLVKILLQKFDPSIFKRLKDFEEGKSPTVFLSYSHEDTDRVNKYDQWLRDNGVKVLRDIRDFIPGMGLKENIQRVISVADKVIAIFSLNAKLSDWSRQEVYLARQLEEEGCGSILIYLLLDGINPPQDDPNRLAVIAKGKTLREIGQELLKGIRGSVFEETRYEYDENEIF